MFNRFWRADPARARTTGGTGLGLAISLEDARLHDGWLQAWGEPGEGSCFRLTLPRRSGVPIDRSPLPLVPDEQSRRRRCPQGAAGHRPRVAGRGVMRLRPGVVRLRPLALAVAAGLVCAVSACGGLPSGGPVQQGMAVGEPAQQPIHVSPFGPVVGASAEATIRGFLSAGYGFEDDHAVARSFLTPAASDAWKPDVGVTVHGDTDASVKVTVADGTVHVATSPIAVVDGDGYYHEAPAGSVAARVVRPHQGGGTVADLVLAQGFRALAERL